jgi:hypothetical protein
MTRRIPPKVTIAGTGAKGYQSGYIVGRFSAGVGPLELLGEAQLHVMGIASRDEVIQRTSNAGFGFFAGGLLLDNENLGSGSLPFQCTFRDGNASTLVNSQVPAAAAAELKLMADVAGIPTQVGSIDFAMGSTDGVVTWVGGEFILTPGQTFTILAPSPADATLAAVGGTLTGTK